jgi:CheY-like chemotaxis protein
MPAFAITVPQAGGDSVIPRSSASLQATGMDDDITKPIRVEALVAALAQSGARKER